MRFELNRFNYRTLSYIAGVIRKSGAKRMDIRIADNTDSMPPFYDLMPFVYHFLDHENFFEIWLMNFPYCVVNGASKDHVLVERGYKGEKLPVCKQCLYYKICPGFPMGYLHHYGRTELKIIPDLPVEVMIETESRCNFRCNFCFNRLSFARDGRDIQTLDTKQLKQIIRHVSRLGIGVVRFTGGEPLLRRDVLGLLEYAKQLNVEVRLNTNGSLITRDLADKLGKIVDNVLIPIESWDNKQESQLTNFPNALKRKIAGINLLKEAGVSVVRAGTVMTAVNILNFDKIYKVISGLPLDDWEVYRPVVCSKSDDLNKELIRKLVKNLVDLRQREEMVFIANAIPFCSVPWPSKLNNVCQGALFEDGHSRVVIDPRGFVKPHYFLDKRLGGPFDILKAWQHSFAKKLRNLDLLPDVCRKCRFAFKCRGGSRYLAYKESGRYDQLDPLANPENL